MTIKLLVKIILVLALNFPLISYADELKEIKITFSKKLDSQQVDLTTKYIHQWVNFYLNQNYSGLNSLSHKNDDKKQMEVDTNYIKSLYEGGDRPKSFHIEIYKEPKWQVMKLSKFYPLPEVSINVVLNNGKGDYDLFFALSRDEDGNFKSCYYVDR